jgi:hypothetical protein
MKYPIAKSLIVMVAAVAAVAGVASAQNRDDQHRNDQRSSTQGTDQRTDQRDQSVPSARENGTRRETPPNMNDRESQNDHRVASADDKDMTARYRRDHPHSAARCHDGFFTGTRDRNLACSKHGGIDIWLVP